MDSYREDKIVTRMIAGFLGRKMYATCHVIDYAKMVGSRGQNNQKKVKKIFGVFLSETGSHLYCNNDYSGCQNVRVSSIL